MLRTPPPNNFLDLIECEAYVIKIPEKYIPVFVLKLLFKSIRSAQET